MPTQRDIAYALRCHIAAIITGSRETLSEAYGTLIRDLKALDKTPTGNDEVFAYATSRMNIVKAVGGLTKYKRLANGVLEFSAQEAILFLEDGASTSPASIKELLAQVVRRPVGTSKEVHKIVVALRGAKFLKETSPEGVDRLDMAVGLMFLLQLADPELPARPWYKPTRMQCWAGAKFLGRAACKGLLMAGVIYGFTKLSSSRPPQP